MDKKFAPVDTTPKSQPLTKMDVVKALAPVVIATVVTATAAVLINKAISDK